MIMDWIVWSMDTFFMNFNYIKKKHKQQEVDIVQDLQID